MSDRLLTLAEEAARSAGAHLRGAFGRTVRVLDDRAKDLKISADREAEAIILRVLGAGEPGVPVLSEEAGWVGGGDAQVRRWIVDPLDGTVNFARGIPLCCVSIALWDGLEPRLGVIYDFLSDTLVAGRVGNGVHRNGEAVAVSTTKLVARAVLATGFPSGSSFEDGSLREFVGRVQAFKKLRLFGSAAWSLAQVATGAVDAYAENGIYFWDVAAGLALVRAGGGTFVVSPCDTRWRCDVAATNGRLPVDPEKWNLNES